MSINAYREVSNATLSAIRFPERNYSGLGSGAERQTAFAEVRKKYGLSVSKAQKVAQRGVSEHFVGLTNSQTESKRKKQLRTEPLIYRWNTSHKSLVF